ncbi:MAG TPA: acyloxyacyl hydrolase [Vicinamibacterales bacterium]
MTDQHLRARTARLFVAAAVASCLSGVAFAQDATVPVDAASPVSSQESPRGDGRVQYPAGLANSFVTVSAGYIGYAFSQQQLEPGHSVGSIDVPHTAARVVLFGHHFGDHFALQGSYMRPIKYVRYRSLDGTEATDTVWMHYGTVTAQTRVPIGGRLSLFGEGGLAITNRRGFELNAQPAVKDARFASVLLGGGIEYPLTPVLDLLVGTTVIPAHSADNTPATIFTSAGIRFNMRPLPPERVAESVAAGYIFPENIVQAGYATDAFGFSVNHFFNKTVPIFWGGDVKVRHSVVSLLWERNVFHTKKVFALDFGVSYSEWRSRNDDNGFRTLSFFPVLRFNVFRAKPADVYVSFSEAGPTYISRVVIDGLQTGSHFTFQDFMAVGMFVGRNRRLNVELNLNHYSNGNLMADNAGVTVPLALKLGYAF